MAQVKKANVPATHPSVWIGLGLALVGLFVAAYAYTGSRIYDITFAFIALVGGLVALAGILVSAWGRSILASRATRSKRALIHDDAIKLTETDVARPPTVAAPAEKKSMKFPFPKRKEKAEAAPTAQGSGGVFAFRRREAPPKAAAPEAAPVEGESRAVPVAAAAADAPALERYTVKCPRCSTQFSAEGARPLPISCPSCGLAGTL